MCAMELGQAASKLLSALEQLGNSSGSGLHGSDSPGKPPDDLVKAFEEALESANKSAEIGDNPAKTQSLEGVTAPEEVPKPGPATEMPGLGVRTVEPQNKVQDIPTSQQVNETSKSQTVDQNINENSIRIEQNVESAPIEPSNKVDTKIETKESPKEIMQELNSIIEKIATPGSSLSHAEMFRLQYILGMLKMQSTSGLKISQSSSQAIESVLKQNG